MAIVVGAQQWKLAVEEEVVVTSAKLLDRHGVGCGAALLVEAEVVRAAMVDHSLLTVRSRGHPRCGEILMGGDPGAMLRVTI